jgi:hypothetical protein
LIPVAAAEAEVLADAEVLAGAELVAAVALELLEPELQAAMVVTAATAAKARTAGLRTPTTDVLL